VNTNTVTNYHLLVLELLGDVARTGAGNFNPRLREEGARRDCEDDVDGGMDGVKNGGLDCVGRRHVVSDTANGLELG
jgi:hypothetical protein